MVPTGKCRGTMYPCSCSLQSSATKVRFFMTNMFFDSDVIASYLRDIRSSASLFSLKFRLGGHSLRVETDRWLRPKPPREQRICRHCSMQAVEDEQHFLFDCPFYSIIRGQHFSVLGPNYQQRDLRHFFEQNSHQLGFVAHHIHLCFQARMSDESRDMCTTGSIPQTVRYYMK